jgi:hypothetical protein
LLSFGFVGLPLHILELFQRIAGPGLLRRSDEWRKQERRRSQ